MRRRECFTFDRSLILHSFTARIWISAASGAIHVCEYIACNAFYLQRSLVSNVERKNRQSRRSPLRFPAGRRAASGERASNACVSSVQSYVQAAGGAGGGAGYLSPLPALGQLAAPLRHARPHTPLRHPHVTSTTHPHHLHGTPHPTPAADHAAARSHEIYMLRIRLTSRIGIPVLL